MPLADDDLRSLLVAVPAPAIDLDADLAVVRARTHGRRRLRRAVTGSLAFVVLLMAGGLGLLVRADDDHGPRSIVAQPAPTSPSVTTTTRLPPDVATIPTSAIETFPAPQGSGATLALGGGSVWIGGLPPDAAACNPKCGQITRLDPETGAVQATITVPKYPRALAYGFGALWAEVEVPDNTAALVVKIDPATNEVVAQAEIPDVVVSGSTGNPRLAVGAGAVWSLYGNYLTKIDPGSGSILKNVQRAVGGDGIVANDEGLWVIENGARQGVSAIDPTSLEWRQIASLPLGYIQSSTLDGNTVWLTEAHGGSSGAADPVIELVKIDLATGQITFTGTPTTNVAAGGGRVWFQGFAGVRLDDTHPDDVVEIDPATARMLRAATVGLSALQPPLLAVDAESVWLLGQGGLIRLRYP